MKNLLKKDNIQTGIWVMIFISVTIFVFEPVKNYLGNVREYWYTLGAVFPLWVICALASLAVGIIAVLLLRKYSYVWVVVGIIAIGLYIQGNFIPNTMGPLNGVRINWNVICIDRIASDILWILVIGLLILTGFLCFRSSKKLDIASKMLKIIKTLMICLLLVELVTTVTLLISHPDFNDKPYADVTTQGQFELSSEKNMIVLLLDNYDSQYFADAIDDDVRELLTDFTYYRDTTSMYGHTDLSFPQMMAGEGYLNQEPYIDYLRRIYNDAEKLGWLFDDGYNVGVYTTSLIPTDSIMDNCVNIDDIDCRISSRKRFLTYIYRMVAYNVVPYHLKQFFWFYPEFDDMKMSPSSDYDLYTWYNQPFYEGLDNMQLEVETPAFRLYHIKGMHSMFETNSDVVDSTKEVPMEETRIANFKIIERMIDNLKELDVYDNTVIVILADHGDTFLETDGSPIFGLPSNMDEREKEWKQNPLLLIKGLGEKHEFAELDRKVSYKDLPSIFAHLLEGKDSLDSVENLYDSTPRTFYKYTYDVYQDSESFFPSIEEFISYGNAWQMNEFESTGKVYRANE